MGPFTFDPKSSIRPVVVMVLNPEDPFQRAMWSGWSLRMFLRQAPLYAADYLFVPYTYSADAAVDLSYYMYSRMLCAAREVYGTNETTDEELRRRVFAHTHFATTPGLRISGQLSQLLRQWPQEMRVLRASVAANVTSVLGGGGGGGGGEAGISTPRRRRRLQRLGSSSLFQGDEGDGTFGRAAAVGEAAGPAGTERAVQDLTVGRLDAWYGWLPSPAAAGADPAPLVAWDAGGRGGRSPCGPVGADTRDAVAAVVNEGSAGGGFARGPLEGAWVLVFNASREGDPRCSYGRAILAMQRAGALGVIFASNPDQDVEVMAPPGAEDGAEDGGGAAAGGLKPLDYGQPAGAQERGLSHGQSEGDSAWRADDADGGSGSGSGNGDGEGDVEDEGDDGEEPSIPATMVTYSDGLDLTTLMAAAAAQGAGAAVEFGVQQNPAAWFVADPWVGLAEAGWAQLPALMHAGWAAWWHVYLGRLRARLGAGEAARERVVQVFRGQAFPGPHGITAAVTLPRAPARRFRRLVLDFALGCGGAFDAACPAWDHMVQLFACCDPRVSRCAPCPTTLWRPAARRPSSERGGGGGGGGGSSSRRDSVGGSGGGGGGSGAAGAVDGEGLGAAGERTTAAGEHCGLELGRWATPFRRRVGRWLTDATPLLAALGGGGRCLFTVQTAPWADGNWTATLSLRFSSQPPTAGAHMSGADTGVASEGVGSEGAAASSGSGDAAGRDRSLLSAAGLASDGGSSRGVGVSAAAVVGVQRLRSGGEVRGGVAADAAHGAFGTRGVGAGARDIVDLFAGGTSGGVGDSGAGARAAVAAAAGGGGGGGGALRPIGVVPLFGSAVFDASYNTDRASVSFPTPRGTRAAAIVSLITGHGSDAHGCGEFCPTSHHFLVNGIEVAVRNLTDAGTAWGCADAVLYGAVPNQHGTWFYGRGGWCDGAAVDPWVVQLDLGRELRPPGSGSNNTVWYKGLYGGLDPEDPPAGVSAGYIMMQSVLVFYG